MSTPFRIALAIVGFLIFGCLWLFTFVVSAFRTFHHTVAFCQPTIVCRSVGAGERMVNLSLLATFENGLLVILGLFLVVVSSLAEFSP